MLVQVHYAFVFDKICQMAYDIMYMLINHLYSHNHDNSKFWQNSTLRTGL